MLASVTSVEEALMALDVGVDMIDLKNPAAGALGALSHSIVGEIVKAVDERAAVSATIGDLPMQASLLVEATTAMLDTGVDIVKIGFFGQSLHAECLDALKHLATHNKLIAVIFAEQKLNLNLLPLIAKAGFYGVMIDTSIKNSGHLLSHLNIDQLAGFVGSASRLGLETGLAGSIQATHINTLAAIKPSYLGFRGALCYESQRTSSLDIAKMISVKNMLH